MKPSSLRACKIKQVSVFCAVWAGEPVGACRVGQMAVHLSAHPACDRKRLPVARMWSLSAAGPHHLLIRPVACQETSDQRARMQPTLPHQPCLFVSPSVYFHRFLKKNSIQNAKLLSFLLGGKGFLRCPIEYAQLLFLLFDKSCSQFGVSLLRILQMSLLQWWSMEKKSFLSRREILASKLQVATGENWNQVISTKQLGSVQFGTVNLGTGSPGMHFRWWPYL